MALALIDFENREASGYRCRVTLGSNRLFIWSLGSKGVRKKQGIAVIAEPAYTAPMQGPVHESAHGRVSLVIPENLIDQENHFVQVVSFRNANREGPAISPIVSLPFYLQEEELPDVNFSKEMHMQQQGYRHPDTIPMRFREVPYSRGMFFGALAGLIPQIAPIVGNILGGLTGGGSSGGGNAQPASGSAPSGIQNIVRLLSDPAVMRQINGLIQQLTGAPAPASSAAPSSSPPASARPTAQALSRPAARKAAALSGNGKKKRPYSQAQVAPALLAALPALMPLLRQVLSPETVQAVISQPTQHLQTAINGLKDMAQLGIQSHEQDLSHLRELNPGVNDTQLHELLMSMSVSKTNEKRPLSFKRIDAVALHFTDIQTTIAFGKDKVMYSGKGAIAFPLTVDTPRDIHGAMIEMVVKDAKTLDILVIKKERVPHVTTGPLAVTPVLPPEDMATLSGGNAYLICMALVWKNSRKENLGTSKHLEITLCLPYTFDRVEESSHLIPLNDPNRFGAYWHKIWEGSFTGERKRFELKTKYYTVIAPGRERHARTETKIKITATKDRKVQGMMKAGMAYSIDELNALLPALSPGAVQLTPEELTALRTDDFRERFDQAARYNAEVRGREGDAGAIWVYPEMKLQTLVLKTIKSATIHGMITAFEEKRIQFPLPVIVHFIGARTR